MPSACLAPAIAGSGAEACSPLVSWARLVPFQYSPQEPAYPGLPPCQQKSLWSWVCMPCGQRRCSLPTPGSPSPESPQTSHWQSDPCSTILARGPSSSALLPAPALVRSPQSCFSAHSCISENLPQTFLFPDNLHSCPTPSPPSPGLARTHPSLNSPCLCLPRP